MEDAAADLKINSNARSNMEPTAIPIVLADNAKELSPTDVSPEIPVAEKEQKIPVEAVGAVDDVAPADASLAKEEKKPPTRASWWQMFAYADTVDKMLLPFGVIFAMIQGGMMPFFAIIFSNSMDASVGKEDGKSFEESMQSTLRMMAVLCVVFFVCGTFWMSIFSFTAERQGARIRVAYFKSVLAQDITWFDMNDPSALPSRIGTEVQLVQEALGGKAGMVVQAGTQCIVGIIVAFVYGWELTLCIIAMLPIFAIGGYFFAKSVATLTSEQQVWFGKAGAVAEETMFAIRTVAAFGGEEREMKRFRQQLGPARIGGIKAGMHMGFSFGLVMALFAFGYAIAFWYGAHHMVGAGRINPETGMPFDGSDVILIFFSALIGIMSLNDIAPPAMAFAKGCGAMGSILEALNSTGAIEQDARRDDPLPASMQVIQKVELKDVKFSFPSRQDVVVLKGTSLQILKGQKVALVGESGSGKSTVIQLLERFYDPFEGEVLVNGVRLRDIPICAWRQQIGYVGQEPVLFATSIMNNIKSGGKDVTDEQAIVAAKEAQAFEFVDTLPSKFDTFVGIAGGQVSGGQKQRIAIARALARKPQLMLLDEATSALDNESEKLVQETLDRLQRGAGANLTTIAIAHRLSTVKNSDVIFVMKTGVVVEQGSHDELMNSKGEYWKLTQTQNAAMEDSGPPNGNEVVDKKCPKGHQLQATPITDESACDDSMICTVCNSVAKVGTTMYGCRECNYDLCGSCLAKQAAPDAMERQATPDGGAAAREESIKANVISSKRLSDEEKEQQRIEEIGKYKTPMGRLFRMAKPEWIFFPLAFTFALVSGANMPMQGFLFAESMTGFYTRCEPTVPVHVCPDAMIDKMNVIILYFAVVGFACWIGDFGKQSMFTLIQENLTLRLREMCFESLVKQDIGFFDDPKNSPAGLATSLSRQCMLVSQMTGINFGNAVSSMLSVCAGIALGFIASWKLSLAILALVPMLMVAMVVVMSMMMGTDGSSGKKYSVSGEISSEAILNIRTVRALMAETQCVTDFTKVVTDVATAEAKAAPKKGIAFGFGNASMFTVYILGFGFGARLIDEGLEPGKMYQSLMCIMFGAMGAAFAAAFTPDAVKGRLAAHDIFHIVDRESKIDPVYPTGTHRTMGDGCIAFEDVQFTFPHRPELKVLRGFSFSVKQGQTVALVGPSGSGKSTVIQMLQRFYDPTQGAVNVGGVPLTDFDISWWRKQVGFVGQEPLLFDMSLEENVKYGKPDATKAEVEAAAKKANMDYVLNGKVSWTDSVGIKGGRLSGGQKQRCAIARAIIREPSVLLLDEATSALDSASERVVQDALDVARQGRTTFTIAHRLSTIRDSDIILVVAAGKIVEKGSHDELMSFKGLYWNLSQRGAQ